MSRAIRSVAFLLLGVVGGAGVTYWTSGARHGAGSAVVEQQAAGARPATVWTCSMHPQIRMDHKDICPLCGMDLTPVEPEGGMEGEDFALHLTLSDHARRMASVATAEVRPRELFKEIRTVGKVELDETRVAHIAAWIDGRVDEVFADFPGTPVRRGEHLVSIYSPELLSTQEEFLAAHRREQDVRGLGAVELGGSLAAASRRRLRLWGITDAQLDELLRTGKAQDRLVVYAPIGGTVIQKNIRVGQYVKTGDLLYTIADLSRVWLVLDVYESELSWVRPGQAVEVTLESQPHRPVVGRVAFIEPVLTEAKRTVQVRVILDNPAGSFKPGMYAQALLRIAILADGTPASTGLDGKYVCPMHPYEISDGPGKCRQCGMPLERVAGGGGPGTGGTGPGPAAPRVPAGATVPTLPLAVPAEAVLTTGRRQLVYVEQEPGKYRLVEPKLGPRAGDYYPVLEGLQQGDRVVARGNFLMDSQFQVTGRSSLLYPQQDAGPESPEPASPEPSAFTAKEQASLDKLAPEDREAAMSQRICPVTGAKLGSMGKPYKMTIEGRTLFLCCKGCEGKVKEDPAAAFQKIEAVQDHRAASPEEARPKRDPPSPVPRH